MLLAPERHPGRELTLNDREIQHIHHIPVKEAGITMFGEGGEAGIVNIFIQYWVYGHTLIKNEAVKCRIDQITQGAGKNQGRANDKTLVVFILNDMSQVPGTKDHRTQPEHGKRQFSPVATKFPAIGHPRIFNEIKLKPTTDHMVVLIEFIMGLDPELQHLVGRYNQENDKCYVFCLHNVGQI